MPGPRSDLIIYDLVQHVAPTSHPPVQLPAASPAPSKRAALPSHLIGNRTPRVYDSEKKLLPPLSSPSQTTQMCSPRAPLVRDSESGKSTSWREPQILNPLQILPRSMYLIMSVADIRTDGRGAGGVRGYSQVSSWRDEAVILLQSGNGPPYNAVREFYAPV